MTPRKEAQWEQSASEWALQFGRHPDAVRHLDRLVELEPARATVWAQRGSVRAMLGLWHEAIADFEKATELRPDAAEYFRDLALARLGGGDESGFRRACAEIQARFGRTNNPDRAQWIARTCVLLAPAVGEDAAGLVRAAERWLEVDPAGVHQLETLGAAEMRAGKPDAAITLRRALEAGANKREGWAFLFLAILEKQLRRTSCDALLSADRSRDANATTAWRERVERDTLIRELCTARHRHTNPS